MTTLEHAISAAFKAQGSAKEANKAYLEFIKANFIMPIDSKQAEVENPQPLVLLEEDNLYVPVFSHQSFFDAWAADIQNEIHVYRLSGVDFLKGISDKAHVCLNIGTKSFKVFLPAEIARMRSIILKFFS